MIYKNDISIEDYLTIVIPSKNEKENIENLLRDLIKKDRFKEIGGFDEDLKHTEDWMMSRKISPNKFLLVPDLITQNDRRFKKFGYINMIITVFTNWINRNNLEHFKKEIGYWDHYKN